MEALYTMNGYRPEITEHADGSATLKITLYGSRVFEQTYKCKALAEFAWRRWCVD